VGALAERELALPWPIDLGLTVASHGWAQLAPWHWDPERGRLARCERLGERVAEIAVCQRGPDALAVIADGFREKGKAEMLRRVRRWVSADWDPAPAIAALRETMPAEGALIARGGGRILRCSTFYEDFVKTVLTINISWSASLRMAAALVADPGGGAFPDPMLMLDYGEARLRDGARLGFRAATIIAATRRMLDDGIIDAHGNEAAGPPDYDYLMNLKGIGPYAAAHCALLLHDFRRIPVDTVAVAHLRARHGIGPDEFAARHAACGIYLGLGYRLTRLSEKLAAAAAAG
jgi:N-glycosylase/DNA lyase